MMTISAKRYYEGAKFFFDLSDECNMIVFPTIESFHGTHEILFRIETTVPLLALLGPLEYVSINSISHVST